MIRIAYIIDTIETPSAGTEQQLLMLLGGLDRSRFSPHLICLRDSDWLRQAKFDFPHTVLGVRRILSPGIIGHLRRLARWLREERIDIVQTFFVDANLIGTLGARLARCPVIVSSRRNVGDWHNRRHLLILRVLRRWTTHYLANSRAAAERTVAAEHVAPDKTTVIHNGLDHDRFQSLPESLREQQRKQWNIGRDHTLIGVVANLRPVKNIPSLIQAATRLIAEYPQVRFVSVGDGYQRAELQTMIDGSGLGGVFSLVGRSSDIAPCLAAFDIAVLCSRFESFSNALIEYMAAGRPIVAADVGGNSEAVRDGVTGLLYSNDNQDGLLNALRRLLTEPELARQLGNAARTDAMSRFSRQACLREHAEFYTSLLSARGSK